MLGRWPCAACICCVLQLMAISEIVFLQPRLRMSAPMLMRPYHVQDHLNALFEPMLICMVTSSRLNATVIPEQSYRVVFTAVQGVASDKLRFLGRNSICVALYHSTRVCWFSCRDIDLYRPHVPWMCITCNFAVARHDQQRKSRQLDEV